MGEENRIRSMEREERYNIEREKARNRNWELNRMKLEGNRIDGKEKEIKQKETKREKGQKEKRKEQEMGTKQKDRRKIGQKQE